MNRFRTIVSVIVMLLAAVIGLFLGAALENILGGMILCAIIAGFACVIYVLDNRNP